MAASSGPSTRTVVRIFLTITACALGLYLLYLVRSIIGLIAVSVFLAVVFGPPVDFLSRGRLPRWLAILLVYLALFASIVGIGLLFVPSVVSGVQSLARTAPQRIERLRKNKTFRKYDNRYNITAKLKQQLSSLPNQLGSAAGTLRDVTVGVFSTVVELITVLTIAFFLLLDGQRLIAGVLSLVAPARAERVHALAGQVYRAVAGYVAGNLAISVLAGTVSFVTLLILGIPFAFPLSILMAVFDLLPLVGATIGAVIVGAVTLFHGFPTTTLIWAIVQVAYQQVESNIVFPIVYRRTVNVNGLVTIIAVLIGAQLLGILGALVAIPVAGAVQIVGIEIWRARQLDARATA